MAYQPCDIAAKKSWNSWNTCEKTIMVLILLIKMYIDGVITEQRQNLQQIWMMEIGLWKVP